ncbi:hypothetical protein N7457_006039 [Penicillium paradoxum]|uniref:uncharacterized protein n=1 Tax=Penicillium paradoxum TaxID=176176 RepID=UPI002547ED0C|nr:uncharacterized protein N7457_006039 [Penicillium paradoxum]KAJ5780879.1 hypothetical protein N7457_006039 [Penicillium paradoxum]
MEGIPSVRGTVELMILDYLVCVAISKITAALRMGHSIEHIEWFVNMVELFQQLIINRTLESPLPWDLDLKLRIFHLTNLFVHWEPPKDRALGFFTPLSEIGIQFMDLCHSAIGNVSKSRWFDLGAHLMVHAMLEEDVRFPDQLRRLCAWTVHDNELDAYWEVSRSLVLERMPSPHGTAGPVSREELDEIFPMDFLHQHFVEFFEDLMEVLEVPLILQLERGQVEDLTRDDTRRLRGSCAF